MQETDLRAAIVSPRLVRLLDYWQAKRAGNGLPTRADIDPIDLPDLLGSISLIETVGPQPRLRYRLVGSGLYAAHGGDLTGRYVDEVLTSDLRAVILGQFQEVLETATPRLHRVEVDDAEGNHWSYERLTLPLGGEQGRVAMLLCGYADLAGAGFLRVPGSPGPRE